MVKQRAFTLIELMVVLAVLSLLLMMAVPFTSNWAASAKLRDAENILQLGVGRGKALAQRNALGATGSQAAAHLCLDSDTAELQLYSANSCSGTAVWRAQLPKNLSIKNGTKTFECLALSNRGLPITSGSCNIHSQYRLSLGGENVEVTLH